MAGACLEYVEEAREKEKVRGAEAKTWRAVIHTGELPRGLRVSGGRGRRRRWAVGDVLSGQGKWSGADASTVSDSDALRFALRGYESNLCVHASSRCLLLSNRSSGRLGPRKEGRSPILYMRSSVRPPILLHIHTGHFSSNPQPRTQVTRAKKPVHRMMVTPILGRDRCSEYASYVSGMVPYEAIQVGYF